MSTNSPEYARRYRAKMRAAGKCKCGRAPPPGKATCTRCLSYGAAPEPHPCTRCGAPVKGAGKMCRHCATHFSGLRNAMQRWIV